MNAKIYTKLILFMTLSFTGLFAWGASTGGASFTPTSVEMPIWAISLANSSGGSTATLYHCSGSTDADCYVDIAQSSQLTSLSNKMSSVTVPSGTYDSIDISYCQNASGNSDYTYEFEGSVAIGATTYYTASQANGYLNTTAANEAYASISVPGCSQQYKFATPLTVGTGSTAKMTLFTTVVNMGWATDSVSGYTLINSIPAGYNATCLNSGSNYLCSNSALVIPYFGTGTPTVQYYQFTDTTSGSGNGVGAQLMVLLDSLGNFIGAFPGRIFPGSDTAGTVNFGQSGGFDSQVNTITKNTDGSYIVASGTQTDTSNGFYFSSFSLLSAVNDTATGSGLLLGHTVDYTETRTQ